MVIVLSKNLFEEISFFDQRLDTDKIYKVGGQVYVEYN